MFLSKKQKKKKELMILKERGNNKLKIGKKN